MILRPAQPEDAGQIVSMLNPVIRDTTITFNSILKTPEAVRADLEAAKAADHGFLVSELEGQLLGFASYSQFRKGPGYAHAVEHSIILAPTARGRGVGRALMEGLWVHAKTRGVHVMVAGVSAENAPGIAFHRAIGFAEVAHMREVGRKFDRWIDLILLQKIL